MLSLIEERAAEANQYSSGRSEGKVVVSCSGNGFTDLVFSTYLGGSGPDAGYGIALDGSGNGYVTGLTESTPSPTSLGFPTTTGAFQPARAAADRLADRFLGRGTGPSD